MKKTASLLLSVALLAPTLFSLGGCSSNGEITLRVYNWEEYIDEGGEGSYDYDHDETGNADTRPILDKFEEWYETEYGKSVRVEYSTFGTNEDLYNQLKLGDKYDLVCPSEYMIMKLAAEGMIQPLDFDLTEKHNYYNDYVSPFIREKFENGSMLVKGESELQPWSKYAAGYMWGVTGLVFNPAFVDEETDLKTGDYSGWKALINPKYRNKVTTKDNVRDSYFVGLGILNRDKLLNLEKDAPDYNDELTKLMNDVTPETVANVKEILMKMKENIFGFETDTGKSDMVKGTIHMNFAWSGDAVYAMDEADDQNVRLDFHVPEEGANLFFDGWVMPKNDKRSEDTTRAAHAFINYMSRPDNAVKNSYYIGYTSVIAGDKMFEYALDTYSAEEESEAVPYDVSYFFGKDAVIETDEEQHSRQLYAQFPPQEVVNRCAVMNYYGDEEEAINELWTQIKGERLSAWAIVIICVAVVGIAAFIVFAKLGHKIEFRWKPKKGYRLIKQEKVK